MTVREKIRKLGLEIPTPPTPVGAYLPVMRAVELDMIVQV